MNGLNLCLWLAGLALQAFLLVVLFRRKLVLRVPVFSFLIAFYVVRAAVLYVLSPRMAPPDYSHLYSVLSLADLCLQILVAVEIGVHLLVGIAGTRPEHQPQDEHQPADPARRARDGHVCGCAVYAGGQRQELGRV